MLQKARHYLTTAVCWAATIYLGGFVKLASWPSVPETSTTLDGQILAWLFAIRSPTLDRLFMSVTWAGANILLLPLSVALSLKLLAARQPRAAIFLASATVGASLLVNLGKHLIARPRPNLFPTLIDMPSSHSFPSGHAAQITAFVLAALWLLKRSMAGPWFTTTATAGAGLIVLVCLSRLYLQVHYPSDVLAGGLTATLWVIGLAHLTMAPATPNTSTRNQ